MFEISYAVRRYATRLRCEYTVVLDIFVEFTPPRASHAIFRNVGHAIYPEIYCVRKSIANLLVLAIIFHFYFEASTVQYELIIYTYVYAPLSFKKKNKKNSYITYILFSLNRPRLSCTMLVVIITRLIDIVAAWHLVILLIRSITIF